MKLQVLCENTATCPELPGEHGLSLYLETERHRILFDMGQTERFAENARLLSVDLSQVDLAVLSHGHYDHGGGLERFLRENSTAPVYLREDAFGAYYNGKEKYIGLDQRLKHSPRLIPTGDRLVIDETLCLYSCNDRVPALPVESRGLTEKQAQIFRPDPFTHEQYLLLQEDGRRILLSGCSHKGVLNLLQWFSPHIFIGGFHFKSCALHGEDRAFLEAAAEQMLAGSTRYYTCHCTGTEQYEFLKQRMGERLSYLSTGDCITI